MAPGRAATAYNFAVYMVRSRFLQLGAAVSALAVMSSLNRGFTFSAYQGFSFLIAGTTITAFWALLMIFVEAGLLFAGTLRNTPYNIAIAVGDFMALVFSLLAGSVALAVVFVNYHRFPVLGYVPPCGSGLLSNHYCVYTKTAASLALVAAGLSIPALVSSTIAASRGTYYAEEMEQMESASAPGAVASAPGSVPGAGQVAGTGQGTNI